MIKIEAGSSNVYADIGTPNDNDMLIKARLAARIGQDIHNRGLTQSQAAAVLGVSQPKLSSMLRGQFLGISESKMLDCLKML